MRALFLLPLAALLSGCGFLGDAAPPLAGAEIASVMVFGRGIGDLVFSAATGRDCSVVRLEQGRSYCRPVEPPPAPPPYCTRSLGGVDCWANPEALPARPPKLADAPAPTPAQEAYRTRRWPGW